VWGKQAENVSTTDITRRCQKGLVRMVACVYLDVMKAAIGKSDTLVNADQTAAINMLAGRIDAETAAQYVEMTYKINHWIDSSVNEKLIFEQLLLGLSMPTGILTD
ncbi:MAG: DNA polymerase III subunit delta' C-terminal domain-containing protein, partial [Planctomycetota bacterium]